MPKTSHRGSRRFSSRTTPEPCRSPDGSPAIIRTRIAGSTLQAPDDDQKRCKKSDRLQRPLLGPQPAPDVRVRLGIGPRAVSYHRGEKPRNRRTIPAELLFESARKVFFLEAHDQCILAIKKYQGGERQPEDIRHDADAQVHEKVAEIQRVANVGKGSARN